LTRLVKMPNLKCNIQILVMWIMVMKKRILIVMALGIFVFGYAGSQAYCAETEENKGTAPIIVDSYAPTVVRPGRTWNIYLRVKDNDGDMRDIVTVFMKVGNTPFRTNVTQVDNQDRKDLAGYLFLHVPAESDLLFRHFNFQVSVRDHKGNSSEAIVFPLRFDYVPPQVVPAGWEEVANRPLGAIWIDLDGLIRRKFQSE